MFFAVCAMLSVVAATYVVGGVMPSLNTPHTWMEGIAHSRSTLPPPPARARRVVVLMIDGLGYEAFLRSPERESLMAIGAARRLEAAYPTYTAPNVAAMFTGQNPRESGVRMNGDAIGTLGLDDVLASAWSSGCYVRVRSRTFPIFSELARPPRGADVERGRLPFLLDLARWNAEASLDSSSPSRFDSETKAEIVAVHLGEVDDAGHAHGSDSQTYRDAVDHALLTVRRTLDAVDLERDIVIALSDHGQRPNRGHGGNEAVVRHGVFAAWGRGVRRGQTLSPRPMRDVASTLTFTLGVHTPSSNMGSPMTDLFELEGDTAETRDQIANYLCRAWPLESCRPLAKQPSLVPSDAEIVAMLEEHQALTTVAQRPRKSAWNVIAFVVFAGCAAFVASAIRAKRTELLEIAIASVTLAGPYAAFLYSKGYRTTWSALTPQDLFIPHALQASGAAVAVTMAVLLFRRRLFRAGVAWPIVVLFFGVVSLVAGIAGRDTREVPDEFFAPLLLLMSPLVITASLYALVKAITMLGIAAIRRRKLVRTAQKLAPTAARS